MTWQTQEGVRTLNGAEAVLIRESMGCIADMIEEEIESDATQWEFDVPVFDRLEPIVRLKLLAQVAWALLRETDTVPPLTAINESAVGAIFREIEQSVQFEIESDDVSNESTFWRTRILAVFHQIGDTEDLPDPKCADSTEWSILMDVLYDRILWDADFNDADLFLDKSPEKGRFLKDIMAIDPNYFTAVPPQTDDKEFPQIRSMIRELYRG